MITEQISPRYVELDSWSSGEMIAAMYESQLAAAAAVRGALPAIAAAVDDAVPALRRGGRIVYVGAGTSGRIGVQDGTELTPTYDWPADRLVFVMAGGLGALVQSAEGAEDDEATGVRAMADAKVASNDIVIGIAASGTTPYTIGALRAATAAGAVTVAVANNPGAPLFDVARHGILVESGAEVIAGSTRMNAGTAQKIVLNLLSTAVMVQLGRVYRGLMVDMRACNAKLRRRAERIVGQIVGCSAPDAARLVEQADGGVKVAVLLGFGLELADAVELLRRHNGNLRTAIGEVRGDDQSSLPRQPYSGLSAASARHNRTKGAAPTTTTTTECTMPTAMAREIAEIPTAAEQLLTRSNVISVIADRIHRAGPRIVILCGRGSSGHVGVYLRYLFEARVGLLVSAAAPSIITAYRRQPDMRDALFIVISQSGRSPDLVAATQCAQRAGALTLAIVNEDGSPAAAAADLILPIGAGPENSVAATKTVALSMLAGAQLVAALTHDDDLQRALHRLPDRLARARVCDWSAWSNSLAGAPAAFVAARGYGFGTAREIALKLLEILRLPALGYSAAELRHGPRAAIAPGTPVLLLRQNDEAAATVDDLIGHLRNAGETVFSVGGPAGTLPWIGDENPICDAVTLLVPAYAAIEAEARRRGLDPDNPPHLRKVTSTL